MNREPIFTAARALGLTRAELADALGEPLATVEAWITEPSGTRR